MAKEVEIPIKVTGLGDLKRQLKEAKDEVIALQNAEVLDPKKLEAATQRAGKLKDSLDDANTSIKNMASGSGFEKISNGLGDIGNKLSNLDFSGARDSALQLAESLKRIRPADLKKEFTALVDTVGIVIKGFLNMGTATEVATVATEANTVATTANQTATRSGLVTKIKDTAATVSSTVAKGISTAATYVATAAQWLWNTAILANPLVAFIALLVAAAAAIFAMTKYLNSNEEATRAADRATQEHADSVDKLKASFNEANIELQRSNELEIARAKALGKSQEEIDKLIKSQTELNGVQALTQNSEAFAAYTAQRTVVSGLRIELVKLKQEGVFGLFQDDEGIKNLEERLKKEEETLKKTEDAYKESSDNVNTVIHQGNITRLGITADARKKQQEIDDKANAKALQAEKEHQIELIKATRELEDEKIKVSSTFRLNAQKAQTQSELAGLEDSFAKRNKLINDQATKESLALSDQRKKQEDIIKFYDDGAAELDRLARSSKGATEEDSNRIEVLTRKKNAEEAAKVIKDIEAKKAKIESDRRDDIDAENAAFLKKQEELGKKLGSIDKQIADERIKGVKDATKAQVEQQIDAFRKVENAKVEVQKTGLEKELAINQLAYDRRLEDLEFNEKLTADVRKLYQEQALLELEEANFQAILKEGERYQESERLAKEYFATYTAMQQGFTDTIIEFERRLFDVRHSSDATDAATRTKEIQEQLTEDLLLLEQSKNARKNQILLEGLAQYRDVTEELKQVDKDAEAESIELIRFAEGEKLAIRLESINQYIEASAQLITAGFDFFKVKRQEELLDLQDQKNAELAIINEAEAQQLKNANLTNGQKQKIQEAAAKKRYEIEKKAYDQEEIIKKKQFESDKALKLIQIVINTAVAISKSVAESPITFGLPWSAFAAALGAIQFATVLQTKYHSSASPPQLQTGGGFGAGGDSSGGDGNGNGNIRPNQTVLVGKQFELNEVTGGLEPKESAKKAFTVKAIVVESDITGAQTQIKHIENLSQLGG